MDCWQASIRQTEPQRGLGRHQGLLAARVLLDLVVECAMRIVRLLLTDLFRRAIFVAGWSDSVGTGDYMAIRVATSRIHVAQWSLLSSDAARSSVTLSDSHASTQRGLSPLVANILTYLPKLFGWALARAGSTRAVRGAVGVGLLVGLSCT